MQISKTLLTFLIHLFTRELSVFYTVFGRRGTGKTDWSLFIAEVLHEHEVMKHFASNISIQDDHCMGIQSITNLDDLKEWCRSENGRKLYVFDEIGRTISRRKPMSNLNVDLINEFQILRKFKLSIIACTINPKYVDNSVLGEDILNGSFMKPSYFEDNARNQKFVLYRDLLRNTQKTVRNIPPTSIKFDTYGTAVFTRHGPTKKPLFKDETLNKMWDWSKGTTIKELGWSRSQFHRVLKKFVTDNLKNQRTT